MRRYQLTLLAQQDLAEIYVHIAVDNATAAQRLSRDFYRTFRLLADSPELGTLRPEYPLENVRLGPSIRCGLSV